VRVAVLEQVVYTRGGAADPSAEPVLLRSPGVSKECVAEIVRLCEGWGEMPASGLARPALLSFPLRSTLGVLPGQLFAVMQVTVSARLFFHVLILTESDYVPFGLNPYALQLEDVFLDHWQPVRGALKRLELEAASLAPLVSPLPSETDADLVEEALRQCLAETNLVLPLQDPDEQSDRFLALLLAALPLQRKRKLRFASFTVSDVNHFGLAGLHQAGNTFAEWHRLLMMATAPELHASWLEYLEMVRDCLVMGDLLRLERVSRQSPHRGQRRQRAAARPPSDVLSATLGHGVGRIPWQGKNKGLSPVARTAVTTRARSCGSRSTISSRPAKRRAFRRRRRWLPFVVLGLVALGAFYLLRHGGIFWPWSPPGNESSAPRATLLGVIDVGSIYGEQMDQLMAEESAPGVGQPEESRRQALTVLRQAVATEVAEQSRLFLELARQGVQQASHPEREAERLSALAQRGAVLEQEMQRLLLADVSLRERVFWRDLGELSGEKVFARHDSLRRRAPAVLARAQEDLDLDLSAGQLTAARARVAALSRLASLFSRRQWTPDWNEEAEHVCRALSRRHLPLTAAAYRAGAQDLARLKGVEEQENLSNLAFAPDYVSGQWQPQSLAHCLVSLRRDVRRYGDGNLPPVLRSTLAFHDECAAVRAALVAGRLDELPAMLEQLARSPALSFDPVHYADHLDRLRAEVVASHLAAGRSTDSLPDDCFPGGNRQATLTFLGARASGPTVGEWREIERMTEEPFLARWAGSHAEQAEQEKARRIQERNEVLRRADTLADQLTELARAGQDWTRPYHELRRLLNGLVEEPAVLSATAGAALPAVATEQEARRRAQALIAALDRPWRLAPDAVTVRLGAGVLTEATEAVVELWTSGGKLLLRTAPFLIGPAAPAGTGWVGTQDMAQEVVIPPGASLVAHVCNSTGESVLLAVGYGAAGAELPGGLLRPRQGALTGAEGATIGEAAMDATEGSQGGSIVFRVAEDFWRQLELPAERLAP
jgi:hypothetical protein